MNAAVVVDRITQVVNLSEGVQAKEARRIMEESAQNGSNVRVHLILGKVEVEIESPQESLEMVFDRVAKLIEVLPDSAPSVERTVEQPDSEPPQMEPATRVNSAAASPVTRADEPDQRKHKSLPARKPEHLYTVDLGLSPEQRESFREFYKQKAPDGQNDQVLTVMRWLTKNLGSPHLSRDQIFTGLRTVDEKAPKRLGSVLSNLHVLGFILIDKDGYVMHHTGEDHVDKNLPAKDEGTK